MSQGLTLGLVLTLDPDVEVRQRLQRRLGARDDLWLAPIEGNRLPLAIETRAGEDREAIEALSALPGVVFCDVVYAHFEDCEDDHEPAPS